MASEDFKRKLTAIFSADVEGYGRLTGEDEDSIVQIITLKGNHVFSIFSPYERF